MSSAFVVFTWAALFAIIGYIGGEVMDIGAIQCAAIAGMAGLGVGMTRISRRRRWIAISALVCLLTYLAIFVGPGEAVAAALASLLTLFISAAALREIYEDSEMQALRHHLQLIFGIVHGFQVVTVNQLRGDQQVPVQFGPKHVLTKPKVAVVFERGSRQTRVSGPAFVTTEPFEHISAAFDLRQHSDSILVDAVQTSDGARVRIHATYDFGLDLRPQVVRGEEPLNEREIGAVLALNDMQSHSEVDLRQFARRLVESALRWAAAGVSIDDLLSPQGTGLVEQRAFQHVGARAAIRGQAFTSLLVDEIVPELEYGDVMQRAWAVGRENEVLLEVERARAIAMRDALRIIVDGYSYARRNDMSDEVIARWVLKQTIETITKDPATKVFLPSELQVSVNNITTEL